MPQPNTTCTVFAIALPMYARDWPIDQVTSVHDCRATDDDWIADFTCLYTDDVRDSFNAPKGLFSKKMQLHKGFWTAYKAVDSQLMTEIKAQWLMLKVRQRKLVAQVLLAVQTAAASPAGKATARRGAAAPALTVSAGCKQSGKSPEWHHMLYSWWYHTSRSSSRGLMQNSCMAKEFGSAGSQWLTHNYQTVGTTRDEG